MKNKLLFDLIVYIISPITLILFKNYIQSRYLVLVLISIIVIYSIIIKKFESRINISGIIFSFTYTLMFLLRQNVQYGFNMYIYNTCWLIVFTIIIVSSLLLNKNIFRQICIDIIMCKNENNLRILNNIKRFNLDNDFNNLSFLLILHLVVLILIRVFSIYIWGFASYSKNSNIQIFFNIVFMIVEMYMVSKLISKLNHNIKVKEKKSKIKRTSIGGMVIDIEQYKNMNK